jgi:L-cysteine desulfidase
MSSKKSRQENLLRIIRKEMRPALGVTEPAAIALCAARARQAVGGELQSIELHLDPGVFKNGYSCRIPGTSEQGNPLAALLGALAGDADKGLRVLEGIDEAYVRKAKDMEAAGAVTIDIKEGLLEISIEAVVHTSLGTGRARIERRHDNITLVETNGRILEQNQGSESARTATTADGVDGYTLHDFYSFADSVPPDQINFVLEAVKVNKELVEAGRVGAGLGVGAALLSMKNRSELSNDLVLEAQMSLAMAIDARMGGESKAAMTICGSGDHGIICTIPLAALAERQKINEDRLARAIAVSYLITMYVKTFSGRLSAFCGCAVAAGTGMAAGMAYLFGADEDVVAGTINNMAANITGMICDGGNLGCTIKAVTAAGAGVLSAKLAMNGVIIPPRSGIVGRTVEETMRNIGRIANPGMLAVNNTILDIMRDA